MNEPVLPWEGGCRCGTVRFRVTQPPLLTMVCHCTGCQRMTGSAFSTSMAIPSDGFTLVAGETVPGGLHDPQVLHQHCDACKSWLFTPGPPEAGFVNVRATLLDDARWFEPFIETWTREALPWVRLPVRHSYPEFPPMTAYPSLLAEYAGR